MGKDILKSDRKDAPESRSKQAKILNFGLLTPVCICIPVIKQCKLSVANIPDNKRGEVNAINLSLEIVFKDSVYHITTNKYGTQNNTEEQAW